MMLNASWRENLVRRLRQMCLTAASGGSMAMLSFHRNLDMDSVRVLRAPQRASGASSEKRETTSAPPWAAPRNARRRDAEARGPSRARVPAPTCVWVDPQTEPFEGRGKTKRTSDSIDDIESNPERPEILDESPSSAQALSTTHKPFSN